MGKKFTLNKDQLEELIKKHTVKELVDITGYGESTLYAHLSKHNLITKKRRIYDLKIPYRPVPKRKRVFWTKDQKVKLKELYDKGYTPTLISKTIGKSEFSIYEKLRMMEG
ncbi:hypothetical protein ACYJ2V_001146 [Clostridium botulinum]